MLLIFFKLIEIYFRHEGRTWYTSHRGRLWIAAASKPPTDQEIKETENFYKMLLGGKTGRSYTSSFLHFIKNDFYLQMKI